MPAGALATEEGRARLREINEAVTVPRHLAVRRATSFVEQHADGFVKDQFLQLGIIGVTSTIEGAVRERLSRLYRPQGNDPDVGRTRDEIIGAHISAVPASLRGQGLDAADWQAWLSIHRDIARALDVAIGPPSAIFVQQTHVGMGEPSPPRRRP